MDAFLGKFVDFGVNKFKSITDFNENLETLERNVKLLSDRASDVETDVKNREQSGKKKRKREVDSWFDEVTEVKEGLRALKEEVARGKKNVGALEKMNGRVGELLEQSKHFGTLVLDIYEREECPLPAPQVREEKSKQNLKVIMTWLHVENVSSIGIYGMGGVGKTTLAKHIHNRLIDEDRYHVCWVTVSQGFSIKGLQDNLAKIVNLKLSDEVDELRRAAKLCRAFEKSKNIVIILDDVWDRLCLEKLGNPLGAEGCRLILTTRSRDVCQKMGCQKLLEVEILNTHDAWELFKKSLGDETVLRPDIERAAKSMARRCKGLPLGLITLAGSMRGVADIREWRNALKEFPDDMENGVFNVLQYSYDRLRNTNMQECFLYCALYPEDDKIDRDELIDRFIMEGLVNGDSRQEEFDQGHTILNRLEKACLLEAADEERVKMHDLLREMALRIKPRYMVRAGIRSRVVPEEQDWTSDLDRVSFIKSEIKGIPEGVAPNCPTLSTLLFHRCWLRRIPESFFQHMNGLQVLDLSCNLDLTDLPSCISNLGSLTTLSLRGCRGLRSVPPLGKLKKLRVLDLHGTGIKEVPQGMGNLVELKFLDMGEIDLKKGLAKEILPKPSQLQYLKLPVRIDARGEDLASLELLEEFEGRFCDLHNFNKFMTSRRNYEKDWWYDIFVGPNFPSLYSRYSFGYENHRIEERTVVIKDCTIEAGGGEAPTSIILPHCIQLLCFENCHGLVDNFLSQTTLRGLTCEIDHCDDIEWIINVPSGRNTTTDPHCIGFHRLSVYSLPNLVGLYKGKIASHTFSGLRLLVLCHCHKIKKLLPRAMLQDLKNLECLDVRRCEEMEEIIAEEATDQDESSQLGTSTDILILPKLEQLYLFDLPKLKRICEGKLICDSLVVLSFCRCPKLKRVPFCAPTTNAHPLPALRQIEVDEDDWWETLEWEHSYITSTSPSLYQSHILHTRVS